MRYHPHMQVGESRSQSHGCVVGYEHDMLQALENLEEPIEVTALVTARIPQAILVSPPEPPAPAPPAVTPEPEPLPPLQPRNLIDTDGLDEVWERPREETTHRHSRSSNLSLVLGFCAVLALGVGTWWLIAPWRVSPHPVEEPEIGSSTSTAPAPSHANHTAPTLSQAEILIDAFLRSDSAQAQLQTIRQPERFRSRLEDHWQRRAPALSRLQEITLITGNHQQGHTYYTVQALTAEGESKHFVVLRDGHNGWRIDWEAHVAYNPLTWSEFTSRSIPDAVTLRAYASQGSYYNYHFADQRHYLCVELHDPSSEAVLYAYISRETDNSRPLIDLLDRGNSVPVMVTVQHPSETANRDTQALNQVHLLRFIRMGWLTLGD